MRVIVLLIFIDFFFHLLNAQTPGPVGNPVVKSEFPNEKFNISFTPPVINPPVDLYRIQIVTGASSRCHLVIYLSPSGTTTDTMGLLAECIGVTHITASYLASATVIQFNTNHENIQTNTNYAPVINARNSNGFGANQFISVNTGMYKNPAVDNFTSSVVVSTRLLSYFFEKGNNSNGKIVQYIYWLYRPSDNYCLYSVLYNCTDCSSYTLGTKDVQSTSHCVHREIITFTESTANFTKQITLSATSALSCGLFKALAVSANGYGWGFIKSTDVAVNVPILEALCGLKYDISKTAVSLNYSFSESYSVITRIEVIYQDADVPTKCENTTHLCTSCNTTIFPVIPNRPNPSNCQKLEINRFNQIPNVGNISIVNASFSKFKLQVYLSTYCNWCGPIQFTNEADRVKIPFTMICFLGIFASYNWLKYAFM